jgi:glutathione S-transferase
MKLVIGNKNFSSWSLRPWILMRHAGIAFEEEVIPLDLPDSLARIEARSPAGRVPVLLDGDLVVWDSLAIAETLAERFPEKRLWPADPVARARARSVCAEMHSGFQAMRNELPMKVKERFAPRPLAAPVKADVDRLVKSFEDCRRRFGAGGPFLFGSFSVADAFHAPVVSRFRTYGIAPGGAAGVWADAVWALPAMQQWAAEAAAETFHMARYDPK